MDNFCIIIKLFLVDRLPLKTVIETFDSLGLRGHNDRSLDVPDMISTLNTLYNICFNQIQLSQVPSNKNAPPAPQEPPINIPYLTDVSCRMEI